MDPMMIGALEAAQAAQACGAGGAGGSAWAAMGLAVFSGFGAVAAEVARTLIPLGVLFVVFQVLFLRLPRAFVRRVAAGMISTFVGLALFLQGVNIAFVPMGHRLGAKLGLLAQPWVVAPVGFILGLLVVLAEPSAQVLSEEVEKASSGHIRARTLLLTMAGGVALLVSLGYCLITLGIPLTRIIIPGYLLALGLLRWIDPAFVAIAFDAGAVATGPLTVTFLMSLGLGIAAAQRGKPTLDSGFGLVCLIALASTLAVEGLSFVYRGSAAGKDGRNTP
ncbi:MAG: DUF1538 domain-containing protein [Clostridia bacterium]|nr:DUF1538 domain-containing protein [Clostridia bacterium]